MHINTYCMLNNNNTIWEKRKKEKKNYADGKAVGIAAARADGQRRGLMTCHLCRRLPSA